MSIICCLCGKKKSGILLNHPLFETLEDYRLCIACNDILTDVMYATNPNNIIKQMNTIVNYKQSVNDPVVKNFIEQLIVAVRGATEDNCTKNILRELLELPSVEHLNAIENIQERNNISKDEATFLFEKIDKIKITSGYNFENFTIVDYKEFISTEVAIGLGFFNSIAASIKNFTGEESVALKNKLSEIKKLAFNDLKTQTVQLGANAIIGMDLEYTMFGTTIAAVILSGTAVCIEPNKF